jgi:FKBP-type peptidyl-prolyl cis-trans isomerase SlyD
MARVQTMKITKDTAVTLRYRITDLATGKLLEDGKEPSAYLHGGYGNTFPKVEAALEGQDQGYQVTLDLQPADAFGERNESLVQVIPKTQFPPGVKVGGQLEGRGEDGQVHVFTVKKIKGPEVHLDGNHPLAGQALRVELTVLDVRAASAEEIAHGHVHGAHGHHH